MYIIHNMYYIIIYYVYYIRYTLYIIFTYLYSVLVYNAVYYKSLVKIYQNLLENNNLYGLYG